MKIKFPTILLISFILIQNVLIAQKDTINGIVKSEHGIQAITNVHIKILPNKEFGGITDKTGKFSLSVGENQNVVILEFSHISFHTKIVKISREKLADTTLLILLRPKTYFLDEVEIIDENFQTVFKIYNHSVIDYAVFENRIYLLVMDYSDKKAEMFSVNTKLADTIFIDPPCKPKNLIIDFYGNLDIISKDDKVYQIMVKNDEINFHPPFPYEDLTMPEKLYDFKIYNKYYFSEFETIVKDKINYGYVDEKDKKKVIFYSIFDNNKVDYYYEEMCFLKIITPNNRVPPGSNRRRLVEKYYNSSSLYFDKVWFYNNILNIFFHIKDNLYIVDNLNDKLLKFDENGSLISEIKIVCNKNDLKACRLLKTEEGKIWKDKIIIDFYNKDMVYFIWRDGLVSEIYSLELKTGYISFVKTLPHIFPKKLTIYNNMIYYLYQKPGNLRNFGLYRTELN